MPYGIALPNIVRIYLLLVYQLSCLRTCCSEQRGNQTVTAC